ncbi:MAG: hypothetical protein LBQ07_01700 [Endomicrobium sp.]|jgi:DNA polymerase-3 subunit delta'|nr:hypothetical protein [Endomicrobium sp.]
MFKNILSQQKINKILSDQIKSGKIVHSYIFVGTPNSLKYLVIIEFAKILNCAINNNPKIYYEACEKCTSCKKFSKNIYPDLHFIDFKKQAKIQKENIEKQKILKIDTIRHMQKEMYIKAYEMKWKFFIIDPAEKMSILAMNSLLKVLEEPPKNTIIILLANHKEMILKTIVSRSQILFFQSSDCFLNFESNSEIFALNKTLSENKKSNIDKNVKNITNVSLLYKIINQKLSFSEILMISKNISNNSSALECIDIMINDAERNFKAYLNIISYILDLLNKARILLLKNINVQNVLDNLFFDLLNLK